MSALQIEPYVVGRKYRVPIVRAIVCNRTDYWPVIGPRHEDAEIIGFDDQHWHLDTRFLSDVQVKAVGGLISALSFVVHDRNAELGYPEYKCESIGLMLRKCRRAAPRYPRGKIRWLPELEDAYAGSKIGPSLICPHRGASLEGLTPDEDGCVTCPLHGLRWNCATAEIVRSKEATP